MNVICCVKICEQKHNGTKRKKKAFRANTFKILANEIRIVRHTELKVHVSNDSLGQIHENCEISANKFT